MSLALEVIDDTKIVMIILLMNINFHEQNSHFNLGIVRMLVTFPAEKRLVILKNHSAEFGLDIKTSNACAVTVCIGTSGLLSPCPSACSV